LLRQTLMIRRCIGSWASVVPADSAIVGSLVRQPNVEEACAGRTVGDCLGWKVILVMLCSGCGLSVEIVTCCITGSVVGL